MLKVGITGGIGSGKTIVSKVFSMLGIPVFEADAEAKRLMNADFTVQRKITHLFGEDVYLSDRTLNRSKVAEMVFKNRLLLLKLNEIIHPAVRESFFMWCKLQYAPYVIHEAAILFESGFHHFMDKNIVVVADESIRIKRVMGRDKTKEEDVKDRIENQITDDERVKLADFVIVNNDRELVIPQVLKLDKKIREYGQI